MKLFNKIKQIENARQSLDGTILHFTGTMFGIGCTYDDLSSIKRIDQLKKRESGKGYILLLPDLSWLKRYDLIPSKRVFRVLQQFWPGNLTAILKDKSNLFKHISLEGNVAVRVPQDKLLRDFIRSLDKPLISTSINESKDKPESDLAQIKKNFASWFDCGVVPNGIKKASNEPSTIVSMIGNDLSCLRKGSLDFVLVRNAWLEPKILYVCTGNTCRSPLAEYYTRDKIEKEGLSFRTASVGFVSQGMPMAQNSSKLLTELGIDHRSHISRIIQPNDILDSWLILTMTSSHKEKILEMNPDTANRVFTLSEICGKEFCQQNCDIEDPYGLDIQHYRQAFDMIKKRIDYLIANIIGEEK